MGMSDLGTIRWSLCGAKCQGATRRCESQLVCLQAGTAGYPLTGLPALHVLTSANPEQPRQQQKRLHMPEDLTHNFLKLNSRGKDLEATYLIANWQHLRPPSKFDYISVFHSISFPLLNSIFFLMKNIFFAVLHVVLVLWWCVASLL